MNRTYKIILLIGITVLFCIDNVFSQIAQKNFTSKVPHFLFSELPGKQKEELKNNPLMRRFAESRKKFADDHYRPHYHFVSPEGKLNDPNGLCYWKGNWHLFYQAYPPEDPRQHWGHAISKDLIHWKDLPYAIYPGPERACYSGATFVEEDRVIAMYYGTLVGNMVATSKDSLLLNWGKVSGNAVVPLESPSGFPLPYTIYDPSIWKKNDVYYSLSGGRADSDPDCKPLAEAYLFRSKDLEHWQYMHSFVEGDRFTLIGDDFACPYFLPIGNRYILPFFSHMSGGQYLLGDYDKERDKFIATSHGNFNFGAATPSGVHAPSATNDGADVIVIFNMNSGYPTKGWNQVMSLPRRLSLGEFDDVKIEPAGEVETLRFNHQHVGSIVLPANEEIVLEKINGNVMEMNLQIDPMDTQMIELNILRSPKKEEFTSIKIFPSRGYSSGRDYGKHRKGEKLAVRRPAKSLISLETAHSSILSEAKSRAPEIAPVMIESNESINLRIFIDKSIVEVFINGKQCIAARVYPGRDDSVGVTLLSKGKDSQLISLDAWQMRNIYIQ